jgi:phosphoribosylglycinamide formyltransferase 1
LFKIAVLISGSGSDLQSIIDSIDCGTLNCEIKYVISDKKGAFGLERAKKNGIQTFVFDRKEHKEDISTEILKIISGKVDLLVLAGFLSIIKGDILKEFRNKIINIHPSLIPSFSGNGMYGLRVHKSAIAYGVKFSGCTVHFVDEGTDTGPIIIQKVVPVLEEDTAEELQKRVLEEEHKALPEAIKLISEGKIQLQERRVIFINKGGN